MNNKVDFDKNIVENQGTAVKICTNISDIDKETLCFAG